jgi:hypothetical protein
MGGNALASQYLSSAKAAELLDTSTGVLANLRHHGEGPPYIKFKRKILYDTQDLEEWIGRHKVKTIDSIPFAKSEQALRRQRLEGGEAKMR